MAGVGGHQTERASFRYRTWRPSRPGSVLRVDEAIDEVGDAMFPGQWGRQPAFDQLPLFWRPGKKGIYRLDPANKGFVRVDLSEVSSNTTELTSSFAEVCQTLRRGLNQDVQASAITYEGKKRRLKTPVLYTQRVPIFGTGTVKLGGERCRIWIRKTAFFEWLEDTFLPEDDISDQDRLNLIDVLTNWPSDKGARTFSRGQIGSLTKDWLGIRLRKKDVDQIMEDLPSRLKAGGRPPLEWDNVKAQLVQRLHMESARRAKDLPAAKNR